MWHETPPDELPPDEGGEEEAAVATPLPDQLARDGRIPVDPATGAEYKSGEIPPGWSEPVP